MATADQQHAPLLRVYRAPALTAHATQTLRTHLQTHVAAHGVRVDAVETEYCFYVEPREQLPRGSGVFASLTAAEQDTLHWLLAETFEPQKTRADASFLAATAATLTPATGGQWLVEVGPRMNFSTAWSSNAVAICQACGITSIKRIERATRYRVHYSLPTDAAVSDADARKVLETTLLAAECDRMTQQVYDTPLTSFWHGKSVTPVRTIPIMTDGIDALKAINDEIGLGFDDWDLQYYLTLFKEKLQRNPTDVECFDMGQSNSEHSRHWFFGGKIVVDGVAKPETLFQMVKSTLTATAKANSVIAFHDNSSVIHGATIQTIRPSVPGEPSPVTEATLTSHVLLTAETHNFPSGVAPFPGAETGTGGRIRDVQATGRGAHVIAGVSAYAVGNLHLENYQLPWEDAAFAYPSNLAHPRDILVQASNGASDYGNKFGEPVVTGFTRSFGMQLPNGERREFVKPIMFSAGLGQLDAEHCEKGAPEIAMYVVKVGGPAYRIGMGGGAASSRIQDVATAALDFNAVQRGDAEMENKMNKVIRACIELGPRNPIVSIHDQGAGGNGNVLKEIVEVPHAKEGDANRGGARYEVRSLLVGDETLSVLEIWGAEYQENNALLLKPEDVALFDKICKRENCPYALLGQVTGDGRVVLHDAEDDSTPFDLDLDLVLGKMPQKTFVDTSDASQLVPLSLPVDVTLRDALDRVLRLVSVGSKRFLTSKVDRSVSGLVAQQQTVGPLQLPLANCAVVAQTHMADSTTGLVPGVASACGEQPIKGLLNASAMARLSVGESLTNLVWASLARRGLDDCKCSANWMWAAKLPGEAARMYECCAAMTTFMKELGVSVDGGKDSLSMAAKVGQQDVKAPGTLVITMYAACDDVTKTVTPDLKPVADSRLYYVDISSGRCRLGGSALAQVYNQLGDESPDVDDAALLKHAFNATQAAIKAGLVLAGHDRSDGGLIVTLLEMAFAGNCGVEVDIPLALSTATPTTKDVLEVLFAEELGLVFQVAAGDASTQFEALFASHNVPLQALGRVTRDNVITVRVNGHTAVQDQMVDLRDVWEATSFELEKKQRNPQCVAQEQRSLRTRVAPAWHVTFQPAPTPAYQLSTRNQHRVAVLREEGSNGEREMLAAFHAAGFEVWDIIMSDLVAGRVTLDERFNGLAFVGGFSFADVMGSAKGWAGVVKFHANVLQQFQAFKDRKETFSLGVCNGCQLMALLGWVNPPNALELEQELQVSATPRFVHNESGRYESRFVSVQVQHGSNAVLLDGMAGSSMGVWVAHGEGRAHFTHPKIKQTVLDAGLAPIRYVDDANAITDEYPFNPNGSPDGIAALASADGRHLCLMPHPERVFLKWQWPWMPQAFDALAASPWLRLFQNAKAFCEKVQK